MNENVLCCLILYSDLHGEGKMVYLPHSEIPGATAPLPSRVYAHDLPYLNYNSVYVVSSFWAAFIIRLRRCSVRHTSVLS